MANFTTALAISTVGEHKALLRGWLSSATQPLLYGDYGKEGSICALGDAIVRLVGNLRAKCAFQRSRNIVHEDG